MRLFVLLMTLWGRAGNDPAPRAPTPIASSWTTAATLAALIMVLLLNYCVRRIWLILNITVVMRVVFLDWFSRHILDRVVIVWGGCIAWLLIAPINLHGMILVILQFIDTSAAQIPKIVEIFVILTGLMMVMMMIKLRIKSVIKVIVRFSV